MEQLAKKINDSRLLRIQLPGNPCCIGLSGEFEKFRATFKNKSHALGLKLCVLCERYFFPLARSLRSLEAAETTEKGKLTPALLIVTL